MVDQEEIHNQCLSNDPKERIFALVQLQKVFSSMPDKQQIWNDLHRLTYDKDSSVRSSTVPAIGSAFSQIPDKQQAWNDLHRLTYDEYNDVRSSAAYVLGFVFSQIPDKQQAWNDLHRLTNDEDSNVRSSAASALSSAFSQVPDKQQAWDDLHKLTNSKDSSVRYKATFALGSAFSHIPDKQQAWSDLHRLTYDKDSSVRSSAVPAIGSAFSQIPDKQQAWNDLHRLTYDEYNDVRSSAAYVLGFVFSQIPDKQQAWNDLHRLTSDEDTSVRYGAADALDSAFSQIPDKQQVWNDLLRLAYDKYNYVRYRAAYALSSAFSQMPDKQQAWNDLHRLTSDEDSNARSSAAFALGSVFSLVPDKQQTWNDLLRLTNDENSDVRSSSNHSLGRVSIFIASQAETDEDYKKELEKAIKFFETSAKEASYGNSAQFCLPFYRSFYTIIFKKQEAKEEVDRYLAEAKAAIEDSDSKKQLFEAVENLSEALTEVQNLENLDFEAKKSELNFYRKYCDHVAELMKDTDEKAPFATKVLRKGLPIMDRNLKELLEEIQNKAKTVCQVSQGTATQEIACAVNREVQKWEIGNQEEMARYVENLIFSLKSKISNIPENKNIYDRIDTLKNEKDLTRQYEILPILISLIPQIVPEIRSTVKDAGGSMGTRENASKTYTVGDVHGTVVQGEYIINSSVIITPSPSNSIIPQIVSERAIDPQRMKPTIGIITALPKEYAAVNILLENKNDKYKIPGSGAGRRYCLGEILSEEGSKHNLVLATAGMGNNIAAARASLLLEHFPNVKSIIMVGIAGGVPNPCKDKGDDHVRLGDIVVSNENGVIQYDLVKQEIQEITHRNPHRPPSASLLEAVRYLEAEEILGNRPWEKYIAQSLSKLKIHRPSDDRDILYNSDNQGEVITHPEDPKRIKGQPRVFIGPIASANILQKDPNARDKLRDKFGVKAIEMEASGIADATWTHEVCYLVVRGICDYCDSHKNDDWQQYAAVVAAAYTRALIESMP